MLFIGLLQLQTRVKSPHKNKFHYLTKYILRREIRMTHLFPGGPLVFQTGYHPRKRTFKTHPKHVFFRYENENIP